MKLTCDFCGGYLTELDENCPHCGAVNSQYKRQGEGAPRTIEELKQWYVDHNLPPQEVTRFFIGEDYTRPRAFGIYQDGDRFIVYKNKDDGSRAIRYDGSDEAYAVNELYLKLKERIAEQKANQSGKKGGFQVYTSKSVTVSRPLTQKEKKLAAAGITTFMLVVVAFIIGVAVLVSKFSIDNGYYRYNGDQYYHLGSDWYMYDDAYEDWTSTTVDDELKENHDSYYESSYYDDSYGTSDFEDTTYYSDWQNSQWDSDSNWSSSDSWDSGGGDWSSDW